MAGYRHFSYDQGVMMPVNFNNQIVEGTIEYTINWLVDPMCQHSCHLVG